MMKFSFSKDLYPKEALLKSAYSFTDRAYIHLDADEKDYIVNISFKDGYSFEYDEFKNELLSQTVRMLIYEKTKNIRQLTVARALASTIVNDFPEEDAPEESVDIDAILTDWFDENE